MKKLVCTVLLALPTFLFGQTISQNYMKSTTYQTPVQDGAQNTVGNDDKIEAVSYYDGLGRPTQSVAQRAGGNGQDIISIQSYDGLGRSPKQYLPVPLSANGGNYRTGNITSSINNYYSGVYPDDAINSGNINAYSETRYENSWSSRPLEQAAPGASWVLDPNSDTDHTVKMEYGSNTRTYTTDTEVHQGDDVVRFSVDFVNNDTNTPSLQYDGFYQENSLTRSIVKDENWKIADQKDHTTESYTNGRGLVVLKRTFDKNIAHDTYYVYDDYNNLTYVLPPTATDAILESFRHEQFSQFIPASVFYSNSKSNTNPTAGEWCYLRVIGDQLILECDMTFTSAIELRNGIYGTSVDLPNITIGSVTFDNNPNALYTAKVDAGRLYINGSGLVTGMQQVLSVTLPELSGTIDTDVLALLAYEYHYDDRNRVVEKKIPQKAWEFIVYDKLDRPVLMQTGNLRASNQWIFTKYDAIGRTTYTGLYTYTRDCTTSGNGSKEKESSSSKTKWGTSTEKATTTVVDNCQRTTLQNALESETSLYETRRASALTIDNTAVYYTNNAFPRTNMELHGISYFDDYNFDWNYAVELSNPASANAFGQAKTTNTKTLATGSKTRVLGTNDWIVGYVVYDYKRRPIYTAGYNKYLDSKNISKTKLDFVGRVQETETQHIKGNDPVITLRDYFTYDAQSRLTRQEHQVNNQAREVIVDNTYDALGLLSRKNVGGKTTDGNGLQQVDYAYNIRGWMQSINGNMIHNPTANTLDLFGFKINYDQKTLSGDGALYNGNISETLWRTANTDTGIKAYEYSYDALNRLQEASFAAKDAGQSIFTVLRDYNEQIKGYDKNGNILEFFRTGPATPDGSLTVWDDLDYSYDGNQLTAVREKDFGTGDVREEGFLDNNGTVSTIDYQYDIDGNMISDDNKNIINIAYNHLNQPTVITLDEGVISYIYDAVGVKLKKTVTPNSGAVFNKEYVGGYIYEQDELIMIAQPEGYIEPQGGSFTYAYQFTDHLGNVRLTYADTNNSGVVGPSEIIEESNYYSFGLQQKGYNDVVTSNVNSVANKFKYQGEELEEELGKNTYAYQWRDYDPAIARFNKIDRFANKYDNLTPYHFSANNPIYYKEVRGDSINVAQQYQQQFTQILNGVFGNNAGSFSFNGSDNLVFNGSVKDLTKAQKKVFKGGFSDLLTESTTTNVAFAPVYTATEGGNSATLDPSQNGGEATLVASENQAFNQNYVVVDPNGPTNVNVIEVTQEFFNRQADPTRPLDPANPPFRPANVQTNPSLTTFHGFGHIINGGKSQDKVLGFENKVIKAFNDVNGTNLPDRNQDQNHNSTQN